MNRNNGEEITREQFENWLIALLNHTENIIMKRGRRLTEKEMGGVNSIWLTCYLLIRDITKEGRGVGSLYNKVGGTENDEKP